MTNGILVSLVGELYALSTIPPRTYVHQDRNDNIITTGGYRVGIQGIVNVYKGHTPDKTVEAIDRLAQDLIDYTTNQTNAPNATAKTFHQVLFLNQQMNEAIRGKREGGGLQGLCSYYTDGAGEKIENAIANMRNRALEQLKDLRTMSDEYRHFTDEELDAMVVYKYDAQHPPFCPEAAYTEEEWKTAMNISTSLKVGHIDDSSYYGRFAVGLLYNQTLCALTQRNWWDEIGEYDGGRLLLGALPLNVGMARNDLQTLQENENVQAILSVVEVFENTSDGWITTPTKPAECQEIGIKHLQIPTPDCKTIFLELLSRGVEFIRWNLENGRDTLVHCKAGRGRSALTVMCYLIKYHRMTAEEAFAHVQEMRPQAGFSKSSDEWRSLKTFERLYSTA